MSIRIRKLVLCLLLACLPLQSVAGPAHLLLCNDATPAAAGGSHGYGDGDEHSAHEPPAGAVGTSLHDCYQNYFSAVVHSASPEAAPTGIVFVPIGSASFDSFFPERLGRPPLTVLAV